VADDDDITLEELLAHLIRMRAVNKAVNYDVHDYDLRIAEVRQQIKDQGSRALDIHANTNLRTKGTKMTDQAQSPHD
jgi:hypothetical protein